MDWTGQHFQFERSLGHLFGNNYPFYLHNAILTFYLFICLLLQFLHSITDDDNKVLIKKMGYLLNTLRRFYQCA